MIIIPTWKRFKSWSMPNRFIYVVGLFTIAGVIIQGISFFSETGGFFCMALGFFCWFLCFFKRLGDENLTVMGRPYDTGIS